MKQMLAMQLLKQSYSIRKKHWQFQCLKNGIVIHVIYSP